MTAIELLGSALVFSGVVMAIFFGRRGQTNNVLEEIKGNIWV
ncbi:permease of the drug/metabolite transporter [Vibrio parahaemolyticus AQ3810]|nr:permease of the drug/metabolite transporter [Vibrio parahaemolyticus AQ3810]